MIKFFRHIRRQLLIENKTTKYLKYAIGEILLVMIGILLALQVNNWNNKKIALKKEKNQVLQLLHDAKNDQVFFDSRLSYLTTFDSLQKRVFKLYDPNSTDSILQLKKIDLFLFGHRLAYQSHIISNNKEALDVIQNDTIKKHLKSFYAKYEYVSTAIELNNRTTEKFGFPLSIKYYKELSQIATDSLMTGYLSLIKHNDIRPNLELLNNLHLNAINQVLEFNTLLKTLITKLETYLLTSND